MPYILLPAARLHYQVQGGGPALVFIHASIADSRMWEADSAVLAEHFKVIRYDIRSHGLSSDAAGDFAKHRGDFALEVAQA